MCCCSSPSSLSFAGVLVINFAFAGLIAWMAATFWPFAFVLSLLYTMMLFYLSFYLRNRFFAPSTIAPNKSNPSMKTAADLLAMVGVFAFGVTTLFLPVNLLGCHHPNLNDHVLLAYNNAVVPEPLRKWAAADLYNSAGHFTSSFVQLNNTTMLFAGRTAGRNTDTLMMVSTCGGGEAAVVDSTLENPQLFIITKQKTKQKTKQQEHVCFVAQKKRSHDPDVYPRTSEIFCTDGVAVQDFATSAAAGSTTYLHPQSLRSHHGLVYFKASVDGI